MNKAHRIVLLAHGSSDQRWCHTFEQLATPTLNSVPGSCIAYMELAEPTLGQIVVEGITEGIQHFTVVPLFLAAGRHLRKDVPEMISALQTEHNVCITLAPPIGEHPLLAEAIKDVVALQLQTSEQPGV